MLNTLKGYSNQGRNPCRLRYELIRTAVIKNPENIKNFIEYILD